MILTLELTGIPINDPNRGFPWPHPEFIPKPTTRSSTVFDLSIFQNDEVDFILPLQLYQWRLRELEYAAQASETGLVGIKVTDHYFDPDEDEDDIFEPYNCVVCEMYPNEEEDDFHCQMSGKDTIVIEFENRDRNVACPWDLNTFNPKETCPLPTCLTKSQKKETLAILDKLAEDPYVCNTFSRPVDTRRYVDYLQMVEVPMDFSTIRNRIKSNYYTNVRSVKADIVLIHDNCIKYNADDSDVADAAKKMLLEFNELYKENLEQDEMVTDIRDPNEMSRSYKLQEEHSTDNFHTQDLDHVPVENVSDLHNDNRMNILDENTSIRVMLGGVEVLDSNETHTSDNEYMHSDDDVKESSDDNDEDDDDDNDDDDDDLSHEDESPRVRRSTRNRTPSKATYSEESKRVKTTSRRKLSKETSDDETDDNRAPSAKRRRTSAEDLPQSSSLEDLHDLHDEAIFSSKQSKAEVVAGDSHPANDNLSNGTRRNGTQRNGTQRNGTQRNASHLLRRRESNVDSSRQRDALSNGHHPSRRNDTQSGELQLASVRTTRSSQKVVATPVDSRGNQKLRSSQRRRKNENSYSSKQLDITSKTQESPLGEEEEEGFVDFDTSSVHRRGSRSSQRRSTRNTTRDLDVAEPRGVKSKQGTTGQKSNKLSTGQGSSRNRKQSKNNKNTKSPTPVKNLPRRSTRGSTNYLDYSDPDEDIHDDATFSEGEKEDKEVVEEEISDGMVSEEEASEEEASEEEVYVEKIKSRKSRRTEPQFQTIAKTPPAHLSQSTRQTRSSQRRSAGTTSVVSHELDSNCSITHGGRSTRKSKRKRAESTQKPESKLESSSGKQISSRSRSRRALAPPSYQDFSHSDVDDEMTDEQTPKRSTPKRSAPQKKVNKSPGE